MKVKELLELYELIKEAEAEPEVEEEEVTDVDDEIEQLLEYAEALEKTAELYKMAAEDKMKSWLKKYWPLLLGGGAAAAATPFVLKNRSKILEQMKKLTEVLKKKKGV